MIEFVENNLLLVVAGAVIVGLIIAIAHAMTSKAKK